MLSEEINTIVTRDNPPQKHIRQITPSISRSDGFTIELRETIELSARTILIKAQNTGVAGPREPERNFPSQDDEEEPDTGDQAVLGKAGSITDHISRIVFPAFSLDRGDSCKIHENAYWDLQTHLGRLWTVIDELYDAVIVVLDEIDRLAPPDDAQNVPTEEADDNKLLMQLSRESTTGKSDPARHRRIGCPMRPVSVSL